MNMEVEENKSSTRKRTNDEISECKDKENNYNKQKKKMEFENDEEYEKYLLTHVKKIEDREYVFSEFVKTLSNEMKKYKTIQDMANEIKKLAISNISRNLEIICNNECVSSFFLEKYRVKYINEQILLNVQSTQHYFKQFLILYNSRTSLDDFSLEINTNLEKEEDHVKLEKEEEEEVEKDSNQNRTHRLTEDAFYKTNLWKERIRCKINNINDNSILTKIINYQNSITLLIDHIPIKIKKFDIITKLQEMHFDILNMNTWDIYYFRDVGSDSFRKAMLYLRKKDEKSELLKNIQEKGGLPVNGFNIKDWRKNIHNQIDIRICPPICSHVERIKIDYENAKRLVRKLDASCKITLDFYEQIEEENNKQKEACKRRKIEEASTGKKEEGANTKDETSDQAKETVKIKTNTHNEEELKNDEEKESPIIYLIEKCKESTINNKLDILILYLRFVHNFCFYSAKKFSTYDELARECGHFYMRVNLNKSFPPNLIPIFYEIFNVKKLDYYVNKNGLESVHLLNGHTYNGSFKKENEQTSTIDKRSLQELIFKNISENDITKESFSEYQLQWLFNFEEEMNEALKATYNEPIEIEKTPEFMKIIKQNYTLKMNSEQEHEIRCAKCKKLFNSLKDLPNHIFTKHTQIKMKLITEVEAEIMKKNFYEAPHSFQFLYLMEKKYSLLQNGYHRNFNKRQKSYSKNENIHMVSNTVRREFIDYDDPTNTLTLDTLPQIDSKKKKNDFYDDT